MEIDNITSLFVIYRYDSTTGTFTLPSGGDGFYYFSVYYRVRNFEYGTFDIQINGEVLCTAHAEQQEVADSGQGACSGAIYATEGEYN